MFFYPPLGDYFRSFLIEPFQLSFVGTFLFYCPLLILHNSVLNKIFLLRLTVCFILAPQRTSRFVATTRRLIDPWIKYYLARRSIMKNILIVVVVMAMVMGIGVGSASAANSLQQGTIGFNINAVNNNDNFVITGKYFVLKDLAVLAGFGFGAKGGDASGTDFGIGAGLRKYLKTDDFAPFVGGSLFYSTTKDGNQKDFSIIAEFGAEYFLHKQFSVEGSIGFGYTSSDTTDGTNYKETTIGTQKAAISFNFYF